MACHSIKCNANDLKAHASAEVNTIFILSFIYLLTIEAHVKYVCVYVAVSRQIW